MATVTVTSLNVEFAGKLGFVGILVHSNSLSRSTKLAAASSSKNFSSNPTCANSLERWSKQCVKTSRISNCTIYYRATWLASIDQGLKWAPGETLFSVSTTCGTCSARGTINVEIELPGVRSDKDIEIVFERVGRDIKRDRVKVTVPGRYKAKIPLPAMIDRSNPIRARFNSSSSSLTIPVPMLGFVD